MRDGSRYFNVSSGVDQVIVICALEMLGYHVRGSNVTIEVTNPDALLKSLFTRLEREDQGSAVERPDHWTSK